MRFDYLPEWLHRLLWPLGGFWGRWATVVAR